MDGPWNDFKPQTATAGPWDDFKPTATGGIGEDIAKSAGTGLVKGALGIAGMVPDISAAAHSAANKYLFDPLLNATIGKPSNPEVERTVDPNKVFGSEGLQQGLESVTGPLHKPETTAGEYAQTAGEFAPAALGGGEGLLARLAKQVVAPAVASETAGQATKGTAAEPYARVAAAVAGGGLASALSKAPEMAAPTVDALKASYKAGIDHPDVTAVTFNPNSLANLHDAIRSDLEAKGFRARREGNTFSDLNELSNANPTMARAAGAPASVADVESIRKSLGKTAQEVGPDFRPTSDAAAASAAVKHIDRWFDNLRQPDLLSGDVSKAVPILKDARGDYAAAMRAENLQTKAANAALQAGSSYSGGNINNATRQALRPLAKNDFAKASGYVDPEKEQLSKAIMGNVVGNTARAVGKLAPDSGLKAIHHIAAAVASGGTSIPASLASLAAKLGGDFATTRNVSKLDEMLRARSPLHQANLAGVNNPTIASRVTPGLTLPNPNFVPPNPAPGAIPSGLVAAMLAGQGNRLQSP
jgi:hypothetical protein